MASPRPSPRQCAAYSPPPHPSICLSSRSSYACGQDRLIAVIPLSNNVRHSRLIAGLSPALSPAHLPSSHVQTARVSCIRPPLKSLFSCSVSFPTFEPASPPLNPCDYTDYEHCPHIFHEARPSPLKTPNGLNCLCGITSRSGLTTDSPPPPKVSCRSSPIHPGHSFPCSRPPAQRPKRHA